MYPTFRGLPSSHSEGIGCRSDGEDLGELDLLFWSSFGCTLFQALPTEVTPTTNLKQTFSLCRTCDVFT